MKNPPVNSRRLYARVLFEQPIQVALVTEHPMGNTLEVPSPHLVLKGHDLSESGLRLDFGKHTPTPIIKAVFSIRKESVDVYARFTWKIHSLCGYEFFFMTPKDRRRVQRFIEREMLPVDGTIEPNVRDREDDPDPFSTVGRFS